MAGTLVIVRTLRHPPEKVWQALTDPLKLREWAPFDSNHNLGTVVTTAPLTTVGAAGWHICLDVLDDMHDETPIGRTVGMEVMKFEGWQRLFAEYSKQFGVEPLGWSAGAK